MNKCINLRYTAIDPASRLLPWSVLVHAAHYPHGRYGAAVKLVATASACEASSEVRKRSPAAALHCTAPLLTFLLSNRLQLYDEYLRRILVPLGPPKEPKEQSHHTRDIRAATPCAAAKTETSVLLAPLSPAPAPAPALFLRFLVLRSPSTTAFSLVVPLCALDFTLLLVSDHIRRHSPSFGRFSPLPSPPRRPLLPASRLARICSPGLLHLHRLWPSAAHLLLHFGMSSLLSIRVITCACFSFASSLCPPSAGRPGWWWPPPSACTRTAGGRWCSHSFIMCCQKPSTADQTSLKLHSTEKMLIRVLLQLANFSSAARSTQSQSGG